MHPAAHCFVLCPKSATSMRLRPDATQAKEMLDHLEGVLANEPVEVVMGAQIVEVKPSGD